MAGSGVLFYRCLKNVSLVKFFRTSIIFIMYLQSLVIAFYPFRPTDHYRKLPYDILPWL